MRISGVRVFPVETPFPHRGGRWWTFVRLDTREGVSGYGELYTNAIPFSWRVLTAMIEDLVQGHLLDHDPYAIGALFQKIYDLEYSHHPDLTKLAIVSGLEMACWDIVGKDLGRPVHRLMGGAVRERVRTYTYLYPEPERRMSHRELWLQPAEAARRATHYAELGFTGVKLDPFGTVPTPDQARGQLVPIQYSLEALDRAEETIRLIREAVGGRCDILVGTHGQMTPAGAIRVARRLEPYDPLWLEEPVPPEDPAAMALVARATTIPITTGERLATGYEFAELLRHRAAAVFNLDVGQVGGILEARKIAGMAEAYHVQVSPHVWGGPLIAAASIQLALACPNFLIMESVERFDGLHAELVQPPIEWRDGDLIPSDRPGLGHDLDERVAVRHAPR
ncbi:MAG TPA: mandelate racemase/muconate lactonizing enzyme family protein [Candidatus Dormibacteraeota bacterium]|nr:mandelate racemase/muconate lactonizing enzyme family protein [Candidatus Dormibacteraeota bacterium]